jgi:hypothetical protein
MPLPMDMPVMQSKVEKLSTKALRKCLCPSSEFGFMTVTEKLPGHEILSIEIVGNENLTAYLSGNRMDHIVEGN